jgi:ribosomal protein L37E
MLILPATVAALVGLGPVEREARIMTCARCGKEVVKAHAFCGWCGQPLPNRARQELADERTDSAKYEVTHAASNNVENQEPLADPGSTPSQPRPKEIVGVLVVATFSLIALAVILPNNRRSPPKQSAPAGDPANSVVVTPPRTVEIPQIPRYQTYVPPPLPPLYVPPPMRLPEIPRFNMPPMPHYSQFQRPMLQPVPMTSSNLGGRFTDYAKQLPDRPESSSMPPASPASPGNPAMTGTVQDQIDRVSRSGRYSSLPPIQAIGSASSVRGNATLEIKNQSDYTLTALLGGPTECRVEVGPRHSSATELPPGAYKVAVLASAPDIDPAFGEYVLTEGAFRVEFYIR